MEVVELRVRLHCQACEKAVRQSLSRIAGVKSVEIDGASNKITVLGYTDSRVVVKAIQKTGRKAEVLCSSPLYGREKQSPRLPRGFRCIIPRWGFNRRSKYHASSALLTCNKTSTACM